MSNKRVQPLVIRVHEIPAGGLDFHYSSQTGELNEVVSDLLGDTPSYDVQLSIKTIEHAVQLKGTVAATLNQICSRCAEDFSTSFEKKFKTVFYPAEDKMKNLACAIDENVEEEFDIEILKANEIELGEVIHEQIALEFPFQPVCSEGCKGLCSHCGANLNQKECQCSQKAAFSDSPFAKLKSLTGETNGRTCR